jgi:hypothetical protein
MEEEERSSLQLRVRVLDVVLDTHTHTDDRLSSSSFIAKKKKKNIFQKKSGTVAENATLPIPRPSTFSCVTIERRGVRSLIPLILFKKTIFYKYKQVSIDDDSSQPLAFLYDARQSGLLSLRSYIIMERVGKDNSQNNLNE